MLGERSQVGGRAVFRDFIEPLMMCLYANEEPVDYRLVTIAPDDDDRWYKESPDRVWGRLKILVGTKDRRDFSYVFFKVVSGRPKEKMNEECLQAREKDRRDKFAEYFHLNRLKIGVQNGRLTKRMLVFVASAGSAIEVQHAIGQVAREETVKTIMPELPPNVVHATIADVTNGACNVLVVLDGYLNGIHLPDFEILVNYELYSDSEAFGFFADRLSLCGRSSGRGQIVTFFQPDVDSADELAFVCSHFAFCFLSSTRFRPSIAPNCPSTCSRR